MALTESDLSELLAALKAGEMTDTIRSSLKWILQQLIEAEATAVIGAERHERSAAGSSRQLVQPDRVHPPPAAATCVGGSKFRPGPSARR